MVNKLKTILKKFRYYFSVENCYREMEHRGIAAMGCCRGVMGGDKWTGYLSTTCIGCKYFCDVLEGRTDEK